MMAQSPDSLLRYEIDSLSIYAHPLKTAFILHNNSLVVSDRNEDMAATFGDPSRVLYRSPGISMANDQANGIIHHGLPGELNVWSLYGAEIVNPNHLSNAGTRFDQSSSSSGGVLAMPFEVIEDLTFTSVPRNASSYNSLSGLLDLSFSDDDDSFVKAGLLGMEAAYQSKSTSRFKAHARYSTVGLLSDMGVDFDGESINFQDLFLSFRPTENVQIFGMIASSNNNKAAVDSFALAEVQKDLEEIYYSSSLGFLGTHISLGASRHTLVTSYKRDKRTSLNKYDPSPSPTISQDESEYLKISYAGYQNFNLADHTLIPSVNAQINQDRLSFNRSGLDETSFILEPSLRIGYLGNGDAFYSYEFSMSGLYDSFSGEFLFEPNAIVQFFKGQHVLSLRTGLISQSVSRSLQAVAMGNPFNPDGVLSRTRNFSTSLSWKYLPDQSSFKLLTRAFYKRLYNLPGIEFLDYQPLLNGVDYSNNLLNEYLFTSAGEQQIARSYGVDIMFDYEFLKGINLNLNGSIFDLKYRDYQNNWVDSRYNFGHVLNATISKRFEFNNSKSLMLHSGLHYRDAAKVIEDRTRELRPYWRIDLRAKYTWREKNVLILDIQNVTNRINDGYYYFDNFTNQFELEEQLTTIPIISYKRILGK